MLDELGPTFVKFGQLLSTRPDVVPPDILAELRGLQDDAHPEPFEHVRSVVEAELGLTIEQVFVEFDETPIAAASIGQVHVARLPGGQEVVVKVQRPDAERQLSADIQLLYQVARVAAERVRKLQFIDLVGTVDEFARTVRRELDYGIEARNAEVFRRDFAGDDRVAVPKIYWRYSTSRVLTMERVEGTVLGKLDLGSWSPDDRRRLGNRITETWMQMVFVHGFFHADPHPANVLVRGPDQISLVDFGMTEQLTQRDREATVRLLLDILNQDSERLPRRLRALGVRYPRNMEEELGDRLAVILQRYSASAIGEIDAREVLREIFQTIYRLDITLPARWVMLDKTIATLAGVVLEIYPDLNVFEVARPYAMRTAAQRFRPDNVADRVRVDMGRYAEAFLEYPFQVSELLDEFKDGELEITVRPEGFNEAVEKVQASANRLVLALVASALYPRFRRHRGLRALGRLRRAVADRDPRVHRRARSSPRGSASASSARAAGELARPPGRVRGGRGPPGGARGAGARRVGARPARPRRPRRRARVHGVGRPARAAGGRCPASPRRPTGWSARSARASGSPSTATTTATASAPPRSSCGRCGRAAPTSLPFLPSRFTEGYGVADATVDLLAERGARVLVCVDCGTSAITALTRAVDLGHGPDRPRPPPRRRPPAARASWRTPRSAGPPTTCPPPPAWCTWWCARSPTASTAGRSWRTPTTASTWSPWRRWPTRCRCSATTGAAWPRA